MHARFVLLAFLALSLLGLPDSVLAADPPPDGRDREFEGKEESRARLIQKKFQDAGLALAETHAEALRRKELEAPLESLRQAMEKALLRLAPEKKDDILARYAVHKEMRVLEKIEQPTEAHKERFKELLIDFANYSEGLGDLPKQAAKEPDVMVEREKFHKQLMAVMISIDPKVPEYMTTQQTSIGEYQALERELLLKHNAPLPPLAGTPTPTPAK